MTSRSAAGGDGGPDDPFRLLGLPRSAALTDDDVRSAWRRIAAATHPDRPDGGDPPRFAAASAAYTRLRTRSGRGETLADLAEAGRRAARPPLREATVAREFAAAASATSAAGEVAEAAAAARYPGLPAGAIARAAARVLRGRPAVLAARVLIAAAIGTGSAELVGFAPATPALITGALTWLLLTARHDIAPPR